MLSDKVVIVTGATKGIGLGIAERCAREGAGVVLAGRSGEGFALAEKLAALSPLGAVFVQDSLSQAENCRRLVQTASERFGRLDGLVNNAGIFPYSTLLETDEELFDTVFETNIKSAFFCSKYALPVMRQTGGGSLVHIGSTHAFGGNPRLAAYACSKGALHTLSCHIAKNYAGWKIRSNWITVGWVATPGEISHQRQDNGRGLEELYETASHRIPLGRMQTPEDIADSVVFLLSDASSQITGSDLHVTGGFTPGD